MRKAFINGAGLLAIVLIFFASGCDKLKSRDHLNQGVGAFKSARYGDAVEHFKQAIALDPENPNARLYLATAYMSQWIPRAAAPRKPPYANKDNELFMSV